MGVVFWYPQDFYNTTMKQGIYKFLWASQNNQSSRQITVASCLWQCEGHFQLWTQHWKILPVHWVGVGVGGKKGRWRCEGFVIGSITMKEEEECEDDDNLLPPQKRELCTGDIKRFTSALSLKCYWLVCCCLWGICRVSFAAPLIWIRVSLSYITVETEEHVPQSLCMFDGYSFLLTLRNKDKSK